MPTESGKRSKMDTESENLELLLNAVRDNVSVANVCLSTAWGGQEQVAAADALELARHGVKSLMVCLEDSSVAEALAGHPGVRVRKIAAPPRGIFPDYHFRTEVERWTIQEGANVVHVHQADHLAHVIPWLRRSTSVAVVASRISMNDLWRKTLLHRWLYLGLDAMIVPSQTLKENVLATHALRDWQVRVIHHGLDFDVFNHERCNILEQRKRWGADETTTVIGMVGRLDPKKNQETVIRGVAGLIPKLSPKEKIKLVLVGEERNRDESEGGYLEELKSIARELRVEEIVHFAGFQQDIAEVMGALDIVVMPSRQDTFGLVAVEAMAMECPLIIAAGGSAKEIIGENERGLLMRVADAFDLQQRLRQLLESPDLWREMGKRARHYAMSNFDRNVRFRKLIELYARCLKKRGR